MSYKAAQRKWQLKRLLYDKPELVNNDMGGGSFGTYQSLPFVLNDGANNLNPAIVDGALSYFKANDIAWWGDDDFYPSGHILSSQIQCLNFLFAARQDKDAILKLAQLCCAAVDEVYPVTGENDNGYLAFEFTYHNESLLNEQEFNAKRGKYCTSIDAFVVAGAAGKKILIPIEWKYTETYSVFENKATEKRKGKTRQKRYNQLITNSKQLKTSNNYENSIYYYEPFYELTRQTILVEQMVKKGYADDFLHVLVVPNGNIEFLKGSYACHNSGIENVWKEQLKRPEKFKIIDSKAILSVIKESKTNTNLLNYINARYY